MSNVNVNLILVISTAFYKAAIGIFPSALPRDDSLIVIIINPSPQRAIAGNINKSHKFNL